VVCYDTHTNNEGKEMASQAKCEELITILQDVREYDLSEAYAYAFGGASIFLTDEQVEQMIFTVCSYV